MIPGGGATLPSSDVATGPQQKRRSPDRRHLHSGRSGLDTRKVPMTSTLTATGAPLRTDAPAYDAAGTAAAVLAIAARIAAGFPFQTITRDTISGVVLIVDRDDLPQWLIEFDIPAPEWFPFGASRGTTYLHARWPDHAFDHLDVPFRLACTDGPIQGDA